MSSQEIPPWNRPMKSTTVTRTPRELRRMRHDGWAIVTSHPHPDGKRLIALITRKNPNYRPDEVTK